MPQESSCCLYGCVLCSLSLRGGAKPCRFTDERASYSPSPAVQMSEEAGSQLWLTVTIITGSCLLILINLTCYRGKQENVAVRLFPAWQGAMTDAAHFTQLQKIKEAHTFKEEPAMEHIVVSAPVMLHGEHNWAHTQTWDREPARHVTWTGIICIVLYCKAVSAEGHPCL